MMLFIQQTHISPQTMAVLCKYITSRIGKHYWIRHFISHSHEFIFSVLRIFKVISLYCFFFTSRLIHIFFPLKQNFDQFVSLVDIHLRLFAITLVSNQFVDRICSVLYARERERDRERRKDIGICCMIVLGWAVECCLFRIIRMMLFSKTLLKFLFSWPLLQFFYQLLSNIFWRFLHKYHRWWRMAWSRDIAKTRPSIWRNYSS